MASGQAPDSIGKTHPIVTETSSSSEKGATEGCPPHSPSSRLALCVRPSGGAAPSRTASWPLDWPLSLSPCHPFPAFFLDAPPPREGFSRLRSLSGPLLFLHSLSPHLSIQLLWPLRQRQPSFSKAQGKHDNPLDKVDTSGGGGEWREQSQQLP